MLVIARQDYDAIIQQRKAVGMKMAMRAMNRIYGFP